MSNQSFFTDKTYARGDEAYVSASVALTAAQQAAADAAAALTAVQDFDPDGITTTYFQTSAPTEGMSNGDMWIDSDGGNHLYRYVDKYGTTGHTNLCPNPNGNFGVQSWTAARGTIASDSTVLLDGQYSLRSVVNDVTALGGLAQRMQIVLNVTAGTTYTQSAYLRSSAASAIDTYACQVVWRDNTTATISFTTSPTFTATTADDWVRVSQTVTAPAGAVTAIINWGPWTAAQIQVSDAYFLNGVMWEATSTLNPAIAGGMDGVAWSGTPGASSSVYTPGWIDVQDQSIATALLNAAGAQATADGKIRTFAQTTAPAMTSGSNIGDLWMDTDDNNKIYRWSGTSWVALADPRIDTQAGQITTIQGQITGINGLVDQKAVIWVQNTAPTGLGTADKGDIWIDTSTSNRITKVWDGSAWQDITDQQTLNALAQVATKITTYYMGTAPTSPVDGDLWVDTANGNRLKRWTAPYGTSTRTNWCRNPQPTSTTNWSGLAPVSMVTAPWNSARQAYQATGTGAATAFIFSAPSPVAFNNGESVCVSATVDLPAGTWYRLCVHVRTGNKYYNIGKSLQQSTGVPIRVSDLATLTAADPDVDAALLVYANSSAGALANGVTFRMGDVLIERTANLLSYFDGGSASPATAWSGTANNSQSVYTPGWYDVSDTRTGDNATSIVGIQTTLTTQQGLIDGKAVVWVQTTAPTGLGTADKGDLWINTSTTDRVTKMWDGTAWVDVTDTATLSALSQVQSKITTFYQTSPPTATAVGDLWVDTDDGNKLYRATATGTASWVEITDARTATNATNIATLQANYTTLSGRVDGKAVVWFQNTAPTGLGSADQGDIWIDTSTANRVSKVWDGGAWVDITDTATLSALSQVTGKITTFYSATAPTATAVGDLWIDTANGNRLYRASATGNANWVLIQDAAIATAQSTANSALTTANGKNKATYSTAVPGTTANVAGDIWYQYTGTGQIIGQWIGLGGTSWQLQQLTNTVISSLDAGKITTGFMDVARLNAMSINVEKLAIGVLRTNPVNNSGFETPFTLTNFSDPGQGDTLNWRKTQSSNALADVINTNVFSGSAVGRLRINPSTGTASDSATLWTNTILVKAGSSYNVSWYACATGTGATSGALLYVDVIFGSSPTALNVSSLNNQSISQEDVSTDPAVTLINPYYTVPHSLTPNPATYTAYSTTFDVPAGQTELYASVRFKLINMNADSTLLLDDVAVMEANVGGGTEVTSAGVRVFGGDGKEQSAFMNNRPSHWTVQDEMGTTLASVSAAGEFAGKSAGFDNYADVNDLLDQKGSLSVGGEDYADRMWRSPQGVVAQVYRSTLVSITNIRTEYGIYEMAFTAIPGRHYRVSFSGGTIRANTGAPTVVGLVRVRRTLDGSPPTITNGTIVRSQWVTLPTNNVDQSVPMFSFQGEMTGGASVPTENRILYTLNALNAGATDWISFSNKGGTSAPSPIEVLVEDLGVDVPDVYQGSSGGGTLYTGGTTTEPTTTPTVSKKTYTQTWNNNSFQARRGISVYGNYTINTAAPSGSGYAGYYSSSNGNQRCYYGFTGTGSLGQTISTAISGATVSKVEFYVDNIDYYGNSGGSQRFSMTTMNGMPSGGSASSTIGNGYTGNVGFTTGQAKWITLPSGAISTVVGGGRVAIIGPGVSNATYYYSRWSSNAKLRITYTK